MKNLLKDETKGRSFDDRPTDDDSIQISELLPGAISYEDFLRSKIVQAQQEGLDCIEDEVSLVLKPHQRAIVTWAVLGGRRAVFAAFGLGKSVMQLEIVRLVLEKLRTALTDDKFVGKVISGWGLIVCPLGVRQEFLRDARMLGIENVQFVKRSEDVTEPGIYLTNYESVRDGKLDPNLFDVATLDEAAAIRTSGSKTYHSFLELFARVPYRFVATATPSPNDYIELLNYAGFLGIMDKSAAKTRFFDRDSQKADNLTLRENMKAEFWTWVHSWAVFLQKPSDLGFDDTGYDLPELRVTYHEIPSDHESALLDSRGQAKLFRDAGSGVSQAAAEKRDSLPGRSAKMLDILASGEEVEPDSHWIIWHDLEAEREAIQQALPEAVSVWGTQDLDEREARIIGFSEGQFRYLSTKSSVAGSGCNFQRYCHRAIFLGIGYKFHDWIQAIKRIHRFLQNAPCEIHVIYTEAERSVLEALKTKWAKHEETVAEMSALIQEYGLGGAGLRKTLERRMGVERQEVAGTHYRCINNDTVIETAQMESCSVDMILTSIPFGTQYEYTDRYNDFGHNEDHEGFFRQMDYLTPELLRVLRPGRIAAIHVKDRVNFGNYSGYGFASIEPFHADCIQHFRKHGFVYMGMIHIDTDVVKENNQTYRLGWTECCKDGTKMGVGCPEYVLLFRKRPTDTSNSYADVPVNREKFHYTRARWQIDAHAHWKSSGSRLLTPDEIADLHPEAIPRAWSVYQQETPYSYWEHIALAERLEAQCKLSSNFAMLPTVATAQMDHIWSDVVRQLTLNGNQSAKGLVNHICPLQFDIVDRLIDRYTNRGELVYDPFGGLMTIPYRAIRHGRKGLAVELNPAYFADGIRYCEVAQIEAATPKLFDLDAGNLEMDAGGEDGEFHLNEIPQVSNVAP